MSPHPAEQYNAADILLTPNIVHGRALRTAVIDDSGRYNYALLNERVNRFANVLRGRRLTHGERVLLCLEDSVDFPVCFLGAIRAGAVPVPLNTLMTTPDYAYIVADSEARLVIVSSRLLPAWEPLLASLPHLGVIVSGDESSAPDHVPTLADTLRYASIAQTSANTRRTDVAFWLYTSGTTGKPKGVVHRHSALEFTARSYARDILALAPDDVVFSAAKLFFAYGLGNALTFPFSAGATVILTAVRSSPSTVAAILQRYEPSVFCGVPTLYAMLLAEQEPPSRGRLRLCVSAGEALPETILERWRAATGLDILDGIGTTELLHIFISNRNADVVPNTSGQSVPGYAVRIVGDDGKEVGDDTIGDLEVHGGSTAIGYWKLPELTATTFRNGWVRTGDKYLRRASGHLVYCGRRDDLLKVGGIYVSPMEVENVLLAHPDVIEAAVVGAEDADRLIKPKAIVVARGCPSASLADALIDHVRSQLADYKRPRWVEFVDELPKTATGKIQRFKLR